MQGGLLGWCLLVGFLCGCIGDIGEVIVVVFWYGDVLQYFGCIDFGGEEVEDGQLFDYCEVMWYGFVFFGCFGFGYVCIVCFGFGIQCMQ